LVTFAAVSFDTRTVKERFASHAIAAASRYAVQSIHQAYALMDEVSMSLLPEGTAA
jgi:hypothetical protein